MEVEQVVDDFAGYFKDPWNVIDVGSLGSNFIFLSLTTYSIFDETNYFEIHTLLSIGALACFFMQFKMFYWMRLFPSLAYYVKLI
jgi:hypothetical protein